MEGVDAASPARNRTKESLVKFLRNRRRPSPALIVAIAALSVSLVGTAVAVPIAEVSLNKQERKVTRKIAANLARKIARRISGRVSNRRITKRAPGLSVASANTANSANSANTANTVPDGAVTTNKIADGAVTDAKLATAFLPASTPGIPIAGANIAANGTVRKFFNRFGGEPTVNKTGTGTYNFTFPGLEGKALNSDSIGLVSLQNGAGEIRRSSSGGNPLVFTYDSAGTAADRAFEYVLLVPSS